MTFGLVVQVLVSGLAAGATYGLIAIGFGVVYRLTSVLHFAHAELASAAGFLAVALAAGSAPVSESFLHPARFRLAMVLAIAIVTVASALIYRIVIEPSLRERSVLTWIGATVALTLAIEGVLSLAFPAEAYVFPDVLPHAGLISLGGGATLSVRAIEVLAIALMLGIGTGLLLRRTTYGSALTAISDEPLGAHAAGLPVRRLITSAFGLAGALAAIAGAVGFPASGAISAQTGAVFGLKGLAAAFLAGFRSPERILVCAMLLGVFEGVVVSLHVPGFPKIMLGVGWHDVAPLLLSLGLLAMRRRGFSEEHLE